MTGLCIGQARLCIFKYLRFAPNFKKILTLSKKGKNLIYLYTLQGSPQKTRGKKQGDPLVSLALESIKKVKKNF